MELLKKTFTTLKDDGVIGLIKKVIRYFVFKIDKKIKSKKQCYKDVLFINGCTLLHPQRYRVFHQMEQLVSFGMSCDKVDYTDIDLSKIKYYRCLIVYRCPITPMVEDAIKLAKSNNKIVFYDIDDLVFDTIYTKNLKILHSFSKEERNLYNDGVRRMGETLSLCDYGIASTNRLQIEMRKYLKDVVVNRNVASMEMVKYSQYAIKNVKKDNNKIILGYLSGSITHNDDFNLIKDAVIRVIRRYDNVYLKVVGLLDLPSDMECIRDKILVNDFVDWKELPQLIRSIDINLAPLESNVFNEAKSENKWMEAALVKVPTIASNTGAFKDSIDHGKTGVLCDDNLWEKELIHLIEDSKFREEVANNAYEYVMHYKTTINSGKNLCDYINNKLNKNVFFVLPSTNISGGVTVALHHALVLKRAGFDVSIININKGTKKVDKLFENREYINVLSSINTKYCGYVDTIISTMWITLDFARKYYNCKNLKYLVQGKESEFYKYDDLEKLLANATYNNILNVEYLTVSKWCERWLKDIFSCQAKYIKNGIDLKLFSFKQRNFKKKITILIEGNCEDSYKNVDESFRIVNQLPKDKYEIIYLNYQPKYKDWYKFDKFYCKIPHDEVFKIYHQADILLKTSLLESFSCPPIEMMATGGVCVLIENEGNSEYIKDNYNCLTFKHCDIHKAINNIERISKDKELRDKLIKNGMDTAKKYDWKEIDKDIVKKYSI